MGKTINSSHNEDHASFSPDGQKLFFASDRRGGLGGLDIYVSEKNPAGEWGEAQNMGPNINSPEDETSAFLVNDGNTLYFSSKGHFNMGGYDIFYVNRLKNGNWSEAKNLGYPINTTRDNEFFQPTLKGKTGFIALFDQDEKKTKEIYHIEILPYTEPATLSKSLFNGSFSLILNSEEDGGKITIIYDSPTDTFSVISPGGKSYDIELLRKED